MKKVSQLDQDNYFIGSVAADPSPLESDIYLIPKGAIDAPPPDVPKGYRAKWSNGQWVLEIIPPEKPEQPYPSWTYDEETNEWVPPIAKPDDNAEWDENSQEWIPGPEVLARDARGERDQLLESSDWTQVPDAPVDQAAWAEYRQTLRDVPQRAGFPTDIDWPTKPE